MGFSNVNGISPEEFELMVKAWFTEAGQGLTAFDAKHREKLRGSDGEYEIDVFISYEAIGLKIDVIVECKKYNYPIGRDLVQVLKSKKDSLGSNKAVLFSTSRFQSGAIEYAAKNGIALIQVVDGKVIYIQNSLFHRREFPREIEKYAGLFWGNNVDGKLLFPLAVSTNRTFCLSSYLGL
ncbi:restriction endonuclease [Vibrio cholerae]|uniref:restriction endonuclease n=1 Tax=Vibrio cholerae TaxID=666 RepID=UPI003F96139C